MLAEAYAELFSVVVFRFFFVYGAGQPRMLIPTLIDKVVAARRSSSRATPG